MAGSFADRFEPPSGLVTDAFVLVPLAREHNVSDHGAWMSSIDHIHSTPGFEADHPDPWPIPMTLRQNLADLIQHEREFSERTAFAYTVLDPVTGEVIGCVYVDPSEAPGIDADVRSWVRADRAALDRPLRIEVGAWLERDWPLERVRYAPRD